MSARVVAAYLADLLEENADDPRLPVRRVQSFRAAGLLTDDAGIVVKTELGEEFQVTVVRSR
jgi:hypothetical protein